MKGYIFLALVGLSHAASIGLDTSKDSHGNRVKRMTKDELGELYQIIGRGLNAVGGMADGLGQMEGGDEPWLRVLSLGGQTLGRMFNGMGTVMNPGNGGYGQGGMSEASHAQGGMGGFGQGGMGGMGGYGQAGMGGFGQGGMGGFGQGGMGGFGQGGMGGFGQGGMGGYGQAGMGGFGQGGDTVSATGSAADL